MFFFLKVTDFVDRKHEMKLWRKFVEIAERVMYDRGITKYHLCENIGLQLSLMGDWTDRTKERWVYNSNLILNHKGRQMTRGLDVLFYPWLNKRKNAPKTLPTNISFTPAGKESQLSIRGIACNTDFR